MPQFDLNPNLPGSIYLNTANTSGGQVPYKKKPTKPKKPGTTSPSASTSSTSSTTSTTSTSTSKTPAEIRADNKKKREEAAARAAAKAEARANKYNPLYTAFKSPAELRAEAARLAVLGVAPEGTVRSEYAQRQAGIGGLTTALQERLGGLNTQNIASNAGLASTYADIAAQAQGAGQSAAAAAGAPTSIAAGGNPMVAANLANLNAQTMGLVPAAGFQGQALQARTQADLTKALVDRANTVSANTAKYLSSLQDTEYNKAIAKLTADQNAQRLGISAQGQAQDYAIAQGRLAQGQESLNIRWANYERQLKKDIDSAGGAGQKAIGKVKAAILADPNKWTQANKVFSGTNSYKIVVDTALGGPQEFSIQGASAEAALQSARQKYPSVANDPNVTVGNLTYVGPVESQELPSRSSVVTILTNQLVNAGMGKAQARKWVLANIPGLNSLPA